MRTEKIVFVPSFFSPALFFTYRIIINIPYFLIRRFERFLGKKIIYSFLSSLSSSFALSESENEKLI